MSKPIYDLEERTFQFALTVRKVCKVLGKTLINMDDIKQVIRSSGSVGANYIEANENLGTKDFKMRLKISRKEAKETVFWLRLLEQTALKEEKEQIRPLITEAEELKKILSSIINKTK